jgi:hypothetical protein
MATVSEIQTEGFISCTDPRCPGYEQRPVQVTRRTVAFTYQDNGGDGSIPQTAIERETVAIVQTDEPCEYCGKPTIRAEFERPEYAPVSGQDQLALLNLNQSGQIRDVQMKNLERDKELAEMRAREAERDRREAERDRLFAEMQAELQRRRGGRPRKEDEE